MSDSPDAVATCETAGCPFVKLVDPSNLCAGTAGSMTVPGEENPIRYHVPRSDMVATTERDDMTWYRCEKCGLMFDDRSDAEQHEQTCDAEGPSYIQ